MPRSGRRFAFAAALMAAVGAMFFAGKSLDAGVVGSAHDFSTAIAPSGACSACHIPHDAQSEILWARKLGRYKAELKDKVAGGGTNPNYTLGFTLHCYDCHDSVSAKLDTDASTQPFSSSTDDYPDFGAFATGHKPPAVAFGMIYSGSPNATQGYSGAWTQDDPGGNALGFFETVPQAGKGSGSPDTTTYGVGAVTWPADNAVKPGGHYFKSADPDSPGVRKGDKIPCGICHDPHTTENQAFIRNPLAGSTLTGVSASNYMANSSRIGTRDASDSRRFCIHCHGDSGQTTYQAKLYSNLGYSTSSQVIVPPPPTVAAHSGLTGAACTGCHKHNSVEVGCNSCHSYPGMDNTVSQKQMSRGHWPHVGKPGTGGTDNSMRYACEVCHYNYSHSGTGSFSGSWWTSVDVQFDPALNPAFTGAYTGSGPTYNGQNAFGGSFARGVANGAANGACAGLYCHGENPNRNVMWEGSRPQPKWDNTAGGGVCGDCHRAGATLRQGNHAVHVDNTGANARGPGGVEVFSPARDCSDGADTGCHTAYGKNPTTTHARGTATVRAGWNSDTPVDFPGSTTICSNCHSTSAGFYGDNTGVQVNSTGTLLAEANWGDNSYRLPCLSCHNTLSPARTTMAPAPSGTPAPSMDYDWVSDGHGAAAIDNGSTSTTPDNVYQFVPVPCGKCHDINSRHFGNTTATGNAWRLAPQTNYAVAGGLDKFCAVQCHGLGVHSWSSCLQPNDLPWDHFWIEDAPCPGRLPDGTPVNKEPTDTHGTFQDVAVSGKTQAPAASDKMPLESDIRNVLSIKFLCVTCHDPHGVKAWTKGSAGGTGRSFYGVNTSPTLHMLRYDESGDLCRKCHM